MKYSKTHKTSSIKTSKKLWGGVFSVLTIICATLGVIFLTNTSEAENPTAGFSKICTTYDSDSNVKTYGNTLCGGLEYYEPLSICTNADSNSACQVDLDANMIPITYDTADARWEKSDTATQGDWYNYTEKKWANAVTVTNSSLSTYQSATPGAAITEADVLGYWVYIPRYAYEVQRLQPFNKPLTAQTAFDIKFETASVTPKTPSAGSDAACTTAPATTTFTAKDYRTECGVSRAYGAATGTTWTTHPAFTLGTKELNGIWVGKYETGSNPANTDTAPVIKPSTTLLNSRVIGRQYDIAKSIGVLDSANTGGNGTATTQNYHNLATNKTMMMKNDQWGATAYLSSSIYGTCITAGAASCTEVTIKSDNYTTSNANPASNTANSTTGTIYGVYDMSGGAWEYVGGNYNQTAYSTSNMATMPPSTYANYYNTTSLFGSRPAWSSSSSMYYYNFDACQWSTCGGQANYETTTVQSVSSNYQSWGGDSSYFVYSDGPWAVRGGGSGNGSYAGLFNSNRLYGDGNTNYGFRVVLAGW
jgi:hypothetical protein